MQIPEDIEKVIYLDCAATVYPKPREILEAMLDMYGKYGVNPGRSGYDLCMVGGGLVEETRQKLTTFFGGTDPNRLCFASNASDALNLLIFGVVDDDAHVITTTLEHNSVIRPLNHLKRDRGVELEFVPFGSDGRVDPQEIASLIRPSTQAVVVNHGSNVIGAIQPLTEIGKICRENEIPLIVDVAQTAGVVPIDIQEMNISGLAFTGHKSLLGPVGIGGLYVAEDLEVRHTRAGGTGVKSAHPYHLDEYPFRLEVGTSNLLGIIGLNRAQDWLAEKGIRQIYRHEMEMFSRLQQELSRDRRRHPARHHQPRVPAAGAELHREGSGSVGRRDHAGRGPRHRHPDGPSVRAPGSRPDGHLTTGHGPDERRADERDGAHREGHRGREGHRRPRLTHEFRAVALPGEIASTNLAAGRRQPDLESRARGEPLHDRTENRPSKERPMSRILAALALVSLIALPAVAQEPETVPDQVTIECTVFTFASTGDLTRETISEPTIVAEVGQRAEITTGTEREAMTITVIAYPGKSGFVTLSLHAAGRVESELWSNDLVAVVKPGAVVGPLALQGSDGELMRTENGSLVLVSYRLAEPATDS